MAAAMAHCVSCWSLPVKLKALSLTNASNKPFRSSSNTSSVTIFTRGKMKTKTMNPNFEFQDLIPRTSAAKWLHRLVSIRPVQMNPNRSSIVCDAGTAKKPDSAAKRARQSEKRRVYNKARKSEIRTRMKKVLESLEVLRKKSDAQPEEVIPVEKLIAEAYSVIDKAVQVGTLHHNTGARRKSRLARRKKVVEIQRGWYTPEPAAVPTA
ncbi:hypothetical protein OROGR_012314 [Orobanche gracilis]